jgi:carboxymethylenebutenolidase
VACESASVAAVVDFYGVHPNVTLDFSKLALPVLGLFGERDSFVTPEVAQAPQHALESAGKSVDFQIYPGADHAFFNDTRADIYNPEAARDAWRRTLDFLHANLA